MDVADGARVEAMSLGSLADDMPEERVVGVLTTSPSPFSGDPLCYVNGVPVDPKTVKELHGDS